MWPKTGKALILCAFVCSCAPPEFEALEDVTLTCVQDLDCPEGYFCETRLDPAECRLVKGRDLSPPELVESAVTPEIATAGTLVRALFTVDRALRTDELRVYSGNNMNFADASAEADLAEHTFLYSYEVIGTEGNGTHVIKADLKDTNGNEATVDLGTVVFDFVAPALVGEAELSHARLKKGDTAVLSFVLDEEIDSESLQVLLIHEEEEAAFDIDVMASEVVEDAGTAAQTGQTQQVSAAFTYPADLAWPSGNEMAYPILLRVADPAGNLLTQELANTLILDNEPPALTLLTASFGTNVSTDNNQLSGHTRSGQNLRLALVLNELLSSQMESLELVATCADCSEAQAPVVLDLVSMTGFDETVLVMETNFQNASGHSEEGIYDFSLKGVIDQAGNEAPIMALGSLQLDSTVPNIVEVLPTERLYNDQSEISLSFATTEPLQEEPTATLEGNGDWSFFCSVVGERYQCDLDLADFSELPEGVAAVFVELRDLALNSYFATIPVTLDLTAPVATGASNLPVYRSGQTIAYTLQFSETITISDDLSDGGVGTFNQVAAVNENSDIVQLQRTNGDSYGYTLLADSVPDGDYTLDTSAWPLLTDAAGNAVDLSNSSLAGFGVDVSVPVFSQNSLINAPAFVSYDEVSFSFCLSEPLTSDALTFHLLTQPTATAFVCSETSIGDCETAFQCALENPESVLDETGRTVIPVTLQAVDAAGNVGSANHQVVMDMASPTVVGTPNLSSYRSGQTITYTLQFSEPIQSGNLVVDGGTEEWTTLTAATNTGGSVVLELAQINNLSYEYTVAADEIPDGDYTIDTSVWPSLTDVAGNALDLSSSSLAGFGVDVSVPTFSQNSLAEASTFVSYAEIAFSFCLSESLLADALDIQLLTAPVPAAFACSETTLTDCEVGFECMLEDPDAVVDETGRVFIPVTLQAVDAAGNVGSANSQVKIDLLSPTVEGTPNLSAYRSGQTITYSLQFSESVQVDAISEDGGTAEWTQLTAINENEEYITLDLLSQNSLAYEFAILATSIPDGQYAIELSQWPSIADMAGNPMDFANSTFAGFVVDVSVPQFSQISLANAPAFTSFEDISVSFCLSETVENLEVQFLTEPFTSDFVCTEASLSDCDDSFECVLENAGTVMDDTDRTFIPVTLQAQDAAGNLGSANSQVKVDMEAPTVVGTPNLSFYRSGQTITYTLQFSEPVTIGSELMDGGTTGFSTFATTNDNGENFWLLPSNQNTPNGPTYVFSIIADDVPIDGQYEVDISTWPVIEDMAGNPLLEEMIQLESFVVDVTDPTIDVSIPDEDTLLVFSDHENHDDMAVSFTVSETIAFSDGANGEERNPSVSLAGDFLECEQDQTPDAGITENRAFTCAGQVVADEGIHNVLIQVKDSAGNYGYHSMVIEVDLTAPSLLNSQFVPGVAKAGEGIIWQHTYSEAVVDIIPDLIATGPDDQIYDYFLGGNTYQVNEEDLNGSYQVEVTLRDFVGNFDTVEAGLFVIDTHIPEVEIQGKAQLEDKVYSVEGTHTEFMLRTCINGESHVTENNVDVTIGGLALDCDYGTADAQDASCNVLVRCDFSSVDYINHYTSLSEVPLFNFLMVSMTDRAGNVGQDSVGLRFDFAPPNLVAVSYQMIPWHISSEAYVLLDNPQALTAGGQARYDFIFDEPVFTKENSEMDPSLVAPSAFIPVGNNGEDTLNLDDVSSTTLDVATFLSFTAVVNCLNPNIETLESCIASYGNPLDPNALEDFSLEEDCAHPCDYMAMPAGAYRPSITVYDEAGHSEIMTVDESYEFQVDNERPIANEVVDISELKHLRVPYGGLPSESPAQFLVSDAYESHGSIVTPDGDMMDLLGVDSFDSEIKMVQVYSDSTGGQLLGTLTPSVIGIWYAAQLYAVDNPAIYLSLVDGAGNVSEERVLVNNVEYVVTMGQKVVGSTIENPHNLWASAVSTPWLVDSYREENDGSGVRFRDDSSAFNQNAEYRWHKYSGNNGPHTRQDYAVSFDPTTGYAILFGGAHDEDEHPGLVDYYYYGDTWAFDGKGWQLLVAEDVNGAMAPSPRMGHKMVYDPILQKTVLYGGENTIGLLADTWLFDGTVWEKLPPPEGNLPPPRSTSHHAMVFEPVLGKTVLYSAETDDMWYLNNSRDWQFLDRSPVVRQKISMAYSPILQKTIFFGGVSEGDCHGDTLSYDVTQSQIEFGRWTTEVSEEDSPVSPRYGATMVASPVDGTIYLYGGYLCADGTRSHEIWSYDGIQWQLDGNQELETADGDYVFLGDESTKRMLIFSGPGTLLELTASSYMNVYSKDGNKINNLWVGDSYAKPTAVIGHSLVGIPDIVTFDEYPMNAMTFGGYTIEGSDEHNATLDESWFFNGWGWQDLGLTNRPGARKNHAMSIIGVGVGEGAWKAAIFGGQRAGDELVYGDTWLLSGEESLDGTTTGVWSEIDPTTTSPDPRIDHAMVGNGDVHYLFGGRVPQAYCNNLPLDHENFCFSGELWAFQNPAWTNLSGGINIGGPAARAGHAMAFCGTPAQASTANDVVVFGGYQSTPGFGCYSPPCYDSSTWLYELDNNRWRELDRLTLSPPPRKGHQMVFDSLKNRIILFGGEDNVRAYGDTWAFSCVRNTWRKIVQEDVTGLKAPLPRSEHGMTFLKKTVYEGQTVVNAGQTENGYLQDTWSFQTTGTETPALQMDVHLDYAQTGHEIKDCLDTVDGLCMVDEVEIMVVAGGTAGNGDPEDDGAFLKLWNGVNFEEVLEMDNSLDGTDPYYFSITDADSIGHLFNGDQETLHLKLETRNLNAKYSPDVAIKTDFIQVRILYQHEVQDEEESSDGGVNNDVDGGF